MYQYLVKYFSLHKRLVLPGIGLLNTSTQPARLEFVEKKLNPPVSSVLFYYDEVITDEHFVSFLSKEINASEYEAGNRFNKFINQLINKLHTGFELQLPGVGVLTKNENGYHFTAADFVQQFYPGVTAEKVIRQNAQHTIRVGEDQRTSAEMHEILHHEATRDRWWIAAVVLGIIGAATILYYYLSHK